MIWCYIVMDAFYLIAVKSVNPICSASKNSNIIYSIANFHIASLELITLLATESHNSLKTWNVYVLILQGN